LVGLGGGTFLATGFGAAFFASTFLGGTLATGFAAFFGADLAAGLAALLGTAFGLALAELLLAVFADALGDALVAIGFPAPWSGKLSRTGVHVLAVECVGKSPDRVMVLIRFPKSLM
jgi:hypothetical protein